MSAPVTRESASTEGPQRPPGDELWQRLLLVIDEHVNAAVLHPLDRSRVIRHLQALHRIGERPPYDDFAAFLELLWSPWPTTRKWVRGIWRTILRNPYHRFRIREGDISLATLDRLCNELAREFGLPPLEWRALDVFKAAQDRFAAMAIDYPDLETYLHAERELRTAMATIGRVRELRHGPAATGNWIKAHDATSVDVQEWARLRRKYGRQ